MNIFNLNQTFKPTGDQPSAIEKLSKLIENGNRHQTLLGVTGSGKTFTMANIIAKTGRPALVISHNKTLAAQLFQEFKNFFPENAVHYFVSYYDYYQPEAYIPQTDTYIEKDAKINDFIDSMRHAATTSALTRKDLIIIASVSCIYGIGSPNEYKNASLEIYEGLKLPQRNFLKKLSELQYERGDFALLPGTFRARGESVEIASPAGSGTLKIEWNGNKIDRISPAKNTRIFPAKHFVTPQDKLALALTNIETELKTRILEFKKQNKILEAHRIEQKTKYDIKMIRETGYTHGIENYSRQLSFRKHGEPPFTLLDYLPDNFLTFVDESHVSIPQIRGMYFGDRARKQTLIDHGFRLPSAIDNRPLKFEEFGQRVGQIIYVSATPAEFEIKLCGVKNIAEQLIRPTGLLDPKIETRLSNAYKNSKELMKSVTDEIKQRRDDNQRTLVTTLTKRTAEDLADFLKEKNIKAEYLHSDIKTMERVKILKDLRSGKYDVIVGVNLLREGLDLPEVSLVIILDADKEGFLRNYQTLIQTIGRAARHTHGTVLMYGDAITDSMKRAIHETERRRKIQKTYNEKHNITPVAIKKEIGESIFDSFTEVENKKREIFIQTKDELLNSKEEIMKEMLASAKKLDFEKAAELRDLLKYFK